MNRPFEDYAFHYDLLYRDKDYGAETSFIESAFRQHSARPVRSVLDLGCGTGGHAIQLGDRGYAVVGIDASEQMINVARSKAEGKADVAFHVMVMRNLQLESQFDAAICMFAALGYLTETEDVLGALTSIRRHLREDGLLILDVWNGSAVLRLLPENRLKVVENADVRLLRFVRPVLDAFHHVCHDHYRLMVMQGDRLVREVNEVHTMRFFFPQELIHYLGEAGFTLREICPFPERSGGKVDETVWNMVVVAQTNGRNG